MPRLPIQRAAGEVADGAGALVLADGDAGDDQRRHIVGRRLTGEPLRALSIVGGEVVAHAVDGDPEIAQVGGAGSVAARAEVALRASAQQLETTRPVRQRLAFGGSALMQRAPQGATRRAIGQEV